MGNKRTCDSVSFHYTLVLKICSPKAKVTVPVFSPAVWVLFSHRIFLLLRWLLSVPGICSPISLSLSLLFPVLISGDSPAESANCSLFFGVFCYIFCVIVARSSFDFYRFVSVLIFSFSFDFRILRALKMASEEKTKNDVSVDSPTSVLNEEVCSGF